MTSLNQIQVKANAHYTCQQCGSTEYIQSHHERPGDDSSRIPLCADCHSKKHPNLPRALFFNHTQQPYWFNKSASSLAKQLGVCSRTVIRTARRLNVLGGELSSEKESLIKSNIPKLQQRKPYPNRDHTMRDGIIREFATEYADLSIKKIAWNFNLSPCTVSRILNPKKKTKVR